MAILVVIQLAKQLMAMTSMPPLLYGITYSPMISYSTSMSSIIQFDEGNPAVCHKSSPHTLIATIFLYFF
jgi:hypothetical protein